MQFKELTDKQWKIIQQHIPKPARTGRPRSNDRMILNGIIYVLITGCRWSEMPEKYGTKLTAHLRFQILQEQGIWKKILTYMIKSAHKQGKLNLRYISIDSSSIHAKKGEM